MFQFVRDIMEYGRELAAEVKRMRDNFRAANEQLERTQQPHDAPALPDARTNGKGKVRA